LAAEHRAQLAKEAKRMMELEDSVSSLEAELSEAKQVLINYAKKEEDLVERKLKLENANNELRTEVSVSMLFILFLVEKSYMYTKCFIAAFHMRDMYT
jgi:hypothetical protein